MSANVKLSKIKYRKYISEIKLVGKIFCLPREYSIWIERLFEFIYRDVNRNVDELDVILFFHYYFLIKICIS